MKMNTDLLRNEPFAERTKIAEYCTSYFISIITLIEEHQIEDRGYMKTHQRRIR